MKDYCFTFSLEITHELAGNRDPSHLLQWYHQLIYRLFAQNRIVEPQEEERLLPYEILADILTRLPAQMVLQCSHHACLLPLRSFIINPSFVDLHLNRATPVIAFQYYSLPHKNTTYKVSINFTSEKTRNMTTTTKQHIKIDLRFASIYEECMSFLYGSHNGFLLFRNIFSNNVLFIWNPVTQEKLTLDTQSLVHTPCAFYYHPKSREHRVLVTHPNPIPIDHLTGFIVVSLEAKLSRKITPFSHPPLREKSPIILNGALHWPVDGDTYKMGNMIQPHCSNSIVAFNIDREEFRTLSHPGHQCDPSATHNHIQIIDMEGKLCYCDFNRSRCTKISLWILEDYEKQVWVKRHVVDTDPMINSLSNHLLLLDKNNVEVVHMYGDELLINLFCRNLFLYNLQLGTFRRAGEEKSGGSLICPVAHINSLVSLKKMDGRHA